MGLIASSRLWEVISDSSGMNDWSIDGFVTECTITRQWKLWGVGPGWRQWLTGGVPFTGLSCPKPLLLSLSLLPDFHGMRTSTPSFPPPWRFHLTSGLPHRSQLIMKLLVSGVEKHFLLWAASFSHSDNKPANTHTAACSLSSRCKMGA